MYHPKKVILFPKRGDRKETQVNRVLFVDPGLEGTGFAFFQHLDCSKAKKCIRPQTHGVFKPKRTSGWQNASCDVLAWFEGILAVFDPLLVVIEMPEAWLSSSKGLAAVQRGDVLKLAFLVGGLAHTIQAAGMAQPMLILPREWKGQLPKKETQRRVREKFKITIGRGATEHEYDAIAMGMAAQGGL